MDGKSNIYSLRGVSSKKEDVAIAVSKNSTGPFPGAFCKAIENPFTDLTNPSTPKNLFLSHADGTGSKSAMAYLYWKETGDLSVFKKLAQDSIVMNTDDLLCVGVVDNFFFSSTIARNQHRIPGEVLIAIMDGLHEFLDFMRKEGISCELMGGETADLGDVVKTLTVDMNAVTFLPRDRFIDTANITPGLCIIGLSSAGQTTYEKEYNSGIGSNGLTSARHDLLHADYRLRYPETYDEITKPEMVYSGEYHVSDFLPTAINTATATTTTINVGQALLSPTRTYLPVIRMIIREYPEAIKAILHLTGGGLTKCLKFSTGIHYYKDNVFDFPPLFKLLAESKWYQQSPDELFEVFNCGQRLELYVEEQWADDLIAVAKAFNLEAQVIGCTKDIKESTDAKTKTKSSKNYLTIKHNNQEHFYKS